MIITVDHFPTERHKTAVIEAINVALHHLLDVPEREDLYISVVFCKSDDTAGECTPIDDDDDEMAPSEFFLSIDNRVTAATAALIACHECVHIKQYVKAELFYDCENLTMRWKETWMAQEDVPLYLDRPWEQEAFEAETRLYAEWESLTSVFV